MKIKINDSELQATFRKLIEAGTDMEPVFRDIGEYLISSTRQRFVDGVGPDGEAWAENSELTLSRKKGDKPLIGETKRLSNELAYALLGDGLEFGSTMEYAAVQQFGADQRSFTGGKSPWGDIPPRPFIGLSSENEVAVRDILIEHLLG
ncbi:MAG: phage virion morphogenesis protein [Zetaproteobacteria bacterium CG02_land_8_20_14_3_00_50_9]|nr:MAG: phage virion morphogenesis protein [Zetaproteobacteria bacterium CG1_02_53_45]PIV30495.1 MAG: phage virion morphogenesis protein [Zetaproteobacteria bacterium CG02_land_8_20_14_3_00_50_9]